MPRNVTIETPLSIRVEGDIYQLITFEDLYAICRRSPTFFDAMAANPDKLGSTLIGKELVLPNKCFNALRRFLKDPELVALARKYLRDGNPWPKREHRIWMAPGRVAKKVPCTWPDCP